MVDGCRPTGRLFYWLLSVIAAVGISRWRGACACGGRSGDDDDQRCCIPGGFERPPSGTLLISWPRLPQPDNKPVAAGSKSVQLRSGRNVHGTAGAECGRDAGRNVVHGGLPAGRRVSEDGVLVGDGDVSDDDRAVRTTPGREQRLRNWCRGSMSIAR